MGSTFVITSPFTNAAWAGEDHFVHSGLWEAVLRTGLFGGVAYLGLLVSYVYIGWQVSSDNCLGALVAANATVILAFSPLTGKMLGPQFFPYMLFAYGLVRWTELRTD
jgi:O-antigen ligase